MSWGWRKILQLRPLIRPFICYRLGVGNKSSLWFDRSSSLSPLSQIIRVRDIQRAGFELSYFVMDGITNGNWSWPVDWYVKYPLLNMYTVPTLSPNTWDRMVCISSNGADNEFYVSIVLDTIRPRGDVVNWHDLVWFSHAIPRYAFHLWLVIKCKLKTQDVLRQWDVSSVGSFKDLCWNSYSLSKKRSAKSVIAKLVFAASSYFIWQERNSRLFANQRRSKDQLIEVIKTTDSVVRVFEVFLKLECPPRVVLFFPSLGFFPMGFSWEGFLWRQYRLAIYNPILLQREDFEVLCTSKWFFPIGVIVRVRLVRGIFRIMMELESDSNSIMCLVGRMFEFKI
ncbi:hypothetical protein Tco_0725932 [Tanacetum coccineum]|uniref:Reverse transcriptase zinc-binding domain-containing protein n=1 Tax=Tanacetum coccineum TaxID=301880 RepID=A0ABQ4YGE0_9ASTR